MTSARGRSDPRAASVRTRRVGRPVGALAVALLVLGAGPSPSHSAFPVDVVPGPPPQPVHADGRIRLLYELHLTNWSASPVELMKLEVFGGDGDRPLAAYRDDELEKRLVAVGGSDAGGRMRAIGGGRRVVIFLDLILPGDVRPPAELRHRLSLSIPRKKDGGGGKIEDTISGLAVPVVTDPAPVLRAPLRGADWVAFNSLGGDAHRRALNPIDGRMRLAQRFAIDWMSLGPDGRLFHGDPKSNASFPAYGADVLAVADGRISDLKDGLPENAGRNEASSRTITLDNVVGNYLILELGRGRFALYAHLQPGSLRVKVGDRVTAGQVLARLGNSGNSDAPHLHFQVMDANSPLGAEGLPYEIDGFRQLGVIRDPDLLDSGNAWKAQDAPTDRRRELPVDDAVVAFP